MRCTTLTTLLLGVMLYLVIGALVFLTLETHEETLAHQHLLRTKETFLSNNSCVTELDFHWLVEEVVTAIEAGLDVGSFSANLTSRWDMASAIFFCGTIITTIGFGNLSPQTWYGQLFCVCYALVGIPMFGILLAGVGDHMGTMLRRAVAKIENLFLKRKVRPTTVRVISAVLSILIGCLIFLAVPTVVFHEVEDWTFLESLYFVVITLTTVGFGDFVPGGGNEDGKIFKPLVLLWIVFGLAYFASILTMIGNWLRVLSKRTRAEMEELRAHATDWTQNMDFRIPNPLEFNDPFLLQRRRWKRSERRRIRRGAQGTLGHWARGGSENGHLPNHWGMLSSSMSKLEGHSSLERAAAAVKSRPQPGALGETAVSGARLRLRGEPGGGLQGPGRMFPHLLGRSFSLPVARSTSELTDVCLQEGSLYGSESPFDSRSEGSSPGSSFSALHQFHPSIPIRNREEGGGGRGGGGGEGGGIFTKPTQEKDKQIPALNCEPAETHKQSPAPRLFSHSSSHPPSFLPLHPLAPPTSSAPSPACKLLDFFGENLAYIDESSDTLSDRVRGGEEKRRRPRKPKRRSMRRQLSHRWSPLQVRRPSRDTQPPSNPPTPPPDSSQSDRPPSERHTDSPSAL